MINRENNSRDTILMELSIAATCQDCPNHFNTSIKSAKAITQLMAKMILNLVCDKGEEAI